MKTGNFIKKIFIKLSSEPVVGALRLEDSSIQYVIVPDEKGTSFSAPLPPGTVLSGVIQNKQAFEDALNKIHDFIKPGKKEEIVRVAVCLPSVLVFTQSFKIPYIDDRKLGESALLNLQMISPINAENAYMSWQKIGESEGQLELLGAFIQKDNLEKIKDSLVTARFQAITFEFPALGLAKSISETLGKKTESAIILEVSNDGIDFVIIKNNALYFDYFVSWLKIQGSEKEITKEVFNSALMRELQKVSNFSLSHFRETISEIVFIAPGLENQISELFSGLGLKAAPFPGAYGLPPSLSAASGSSIKKTKVEHLEQQINLGAVGAHDAFFEERVKNFTSLWRVISIASISVLIILNGGFNLILTLHAKSLEKQNVLLSGGNNQTSDVFFQSKAQEFNSLVAAMTKVKNETLNWPEFFDSIFALIDDNFITPITLSISNNERVVSMEARAPNNGLVLKFKNVLSSKFEKVDLPLSRTTVNPDSSVNFAISFRLKSN